ncbi:MAG: MFS transporter [Sphingobium sp.]|nr:MFS transporter [Sphingobium sp.]
MHTVEEHAARAQGRGSAGYQALVVGLLSLNFGIVFFDRNSTNFLMPFVQKDLGLNFDQVGSVAGIFSFFWALAAFGVGRLSDIVGNRKLLLVISTLAFSACSFLTGLAASFAMLIGARILMGVAEGGVMPISHAMVASEVSPERRGLAQGIAQNFGSNFFGSFVAPVVLTWLAAQYGWREAFYIAGIPGIVCGLLIWFLIEEPAKTPQEKVEKHKKGFVAGIGEYFSAIVQVMKIRNIWVCVVMGILLVAYLVITWAFMPLYLTQIRGYTDSEQSWLMGTLGISATLGSFLTAGLSDRIGRRPVMIAMPLISMLLPLGVMFYHGSYAVMVAIFFVGWALNGIFPLFMATVPSESVSPAQAATVFGLCMGSCEILGGALGPKIAGILADAHGLNAPMWMMFGLALAGGIFGMLLKETAPSQIAKRKS